MTASALACPRCAARLSTVASSALVDCPACAAPLAVLLAGAVRETILPTAAAEAAAAAAQTFWSSDGVATGLRAAEPEPPILLFVAVAEAERTRRLSSRGPLSETSESAVAVTIPGVPVEQLNLSRILATGPRVPFEPARLSRDGLVFDPTKNPANLFPEPFGGAETIDERIGVVYVPVWLVRRRFRGGLYLASVDGESGLLIGARAPAERSTDLLRGALFVYAVAAIVALPLGAWGRIAGALLNLDMPGVALLLLLPAGLAWALALGWDRIRFRYELQWSAHRVTRLPINRPAKTMPERVRDALAKAALWILSR